MLYVGLRRRAHFGSAEVLVGYENVQQVGVAIVKAIVIGVESDLSCFPLETTASEDLAPELQQLLESAAAGYPYQVTNVWRKIQNSEEVD